MHRFLKHSISPVHIHRLHLLGATGCVSLKWTQRSNQGYILEGKVHCKDLASVIINNVSPERTQGQRFCVTLDVYTIFYSILQKMSTFNTTFLHIVLLSLDRLLLSNLLHGLFLSVSPLADYKPVVQNSFFWTITHLWFSVLEITLKSKLLKDSQAEAECFATQ